MAFFGVAVAPGEPAYFRPDEACPAVTLRRATLVVAGGGDALEDDARVLVRCRVERGARALVAVSPAPPRAVFFARPVVARARAPAADAPLVDSPPPPRVLPSQAHLASSPRSCPVASRASP